VATVADSQQSAGHNTRWAFVVGGVAAIIVGILMFLNPSFTAPLVLQALGAFFVVIGVLEVVRAIARPDNIWGLRLAVGIVAIIGGIVAFAQPVALAVVSVLALYFGFAVLAGLLAIVEIFSGLSQPRSWGLVGLGVLQALLAVMMILYPTTGTMIILPVVALLLIAIGVVLLVGAFRPEMLREGLDFRLSHR
jgi:uncharacterized membrane protein HdeD (DUF308 family)